MRNDLKGNKKNWRWSSPLRGPTRRPSQTDLTGRNRARDKAEKQISRPSKTIQDLLRPSKTFYEYRRCWNRSAKSLLHEGSSRSWAMRPLLSLLLLPPLLTSPAGSRGRALSERFLRVSSERLAFREWQSPAVSVVSGEFRNLPRQVRFVKKSVVRVFRPFGHTPPRCHSCHLSRGTSVPRETWRDQQTNYPPSTRLGLEWAPTN